MWQSCRSYSPVPFPAQLAAKAARPSSGHIALYGREEFAGHAQKADRASKFAAVAQGGSVTLSMHAKWTLRKSVAQRALHDVSFCEKRVHS